MMYRVMGCCVAVWFGAAAFGGEVRTRDGKVHAGQVGVEVDRFVVKPAKGQAVGILGGDVVAVVFDVPATLPSTRPAGWQGVDIGKTDTAGQLKITGERFVLADMAGGYRSRKKGADHCFFVCQEIGGDGTIVARLRQVDEYRLARAGVMIRASREAEAACVMISRGVDGVSIMSGRARVGEETTDVAKVQQAIFGAAWLKLVRKGYTISAFESTDGQKWQAIGSVEVPMEERALVGLMSASGGARVGRTLFDKVELTAAPEAGSSRSPRGVVLRSGTHLAGEVAEADEKKVVLAGADGARREFGAADVARCVFLPLLVTHEEKLAAAPAGVLMINGDFLEGQFRGLDSGRLRISSVNFGAKQVDTRSEAAALVMRALAAPAGVFEVRLVDGSKIVARTMKTGAGEIVIGEAIVGEMKIPAGKVLEIRRIGPN